MDYKFSFTNGQSKSNKHFGADEIGTRELSWFYVAFYVILVFNFNVSVKHPLKKYNKYHPTVQILYYSVVFQLIATVLSSIHLTKYAGDGVGYDAAVTLSRVLQALSEVLLLAHLLLVAKGWTIVRRKISASGRVKIAVFLTAYAFVQLVTRWYAATQIDRGKVLYELATPPGQVVRVARIIAFLWFLRACHTTVTQFPRSKRRFYRKYIAAFSVWFIWIAAFPFLADGIPDYLRYKFAYAFELTAIYIAHLILTVLYNPNWSRSFPFHASDRGQIMNQTLTFWASPAARLKRGGHALDSSNNER